MNDVRLDGRAIDDLLDDPLGPVGTFLQDLASQAADVARAVVQVRTDPTWSLRSDARPPGFTRASITTRLGKSNSGRLWASANAPADPAIFLEDPAEQLHHAYPFLTTGLNSLQGLL